MRNQGLIFIGVVLIAAGLMFLLGNLFDVNIAAFCFPAGLILLGIFLILRPRMLGPNTRSDVILIGDLERSGVWDVGDEEYWSFIADVNYDLTKAAIPKGETTIRGYGFIGDVEIYAPAGVGIAVDATSFVTSFKVGGEGEEERFLAPLHWQTADYDYAERRVRFDLLHFIADVKLRQF